MKKILENSKGFTLPELMISAFILALAFAGALVTYIKCIELNEMSRNASLALEASKTKMTEIQNFASTQFDQAVINYNSVSFTTATLDGQGMSYVTSLNADLIQITVSFCWQQKNGRVIGEDQNLNGAINVGEDQNANGMIDSPVQLVTSIYR